MAVNTGKYYCLGAWYPTDKVQESISRITGVAVDRLETEDQLAEAVEEIVRGNPTWFARFAQDMHELRLAGKKTV